MKVVFCVFSETRAFAVKRWLAYNRRNTDDWPRRGCFYTEKPLSAFRIAIKWLKVSRGRYNAYHYAAGEPKTEPVTAQRRYIYSIVPFPDSYSFSIWSICPWAHEAMTNARAKMTTTLKEMTTALRGKSTSRLVLVNKHKATAFLCNISLQNA